MRERMPADTHSKLIGYLTWLTGFFGSHRFYYGRPITGTIWAFSLGLLGVGWLIDFFLIPGMDRSCDHRFAPGRLDYTLAWLLLTLGGVLGLHRFYQGKWLTGLLYLCSLGLLGFGLLYDLWTLNSQISEQNFYKTAVRRERNPGLYA
jgi:TM2 domain-containing membrane protein YozV